MRSEVSRRGLMKAVTAGTVPVFAGCIGQSGSDQSGNSKNNSSANNGSNGKMSRVIAGWSTEGSSGFAVGQVIAKILSQNSNRVQMDSQSTGAGQNLRLLSRGEVDLGYAQSYSYAKGMEEEAPWNDPPLEIKPWQAFGITPAGIFFIARSGSDIKTISDLAGKSVTISNTDVGAYEAVRAALTNVGVWNEVDERSMGLSQIPNAFSNERIDATFVLSLGLQGNTVAGAFQELFSRSNPKDITVVQPTQSEITNMLIPGLKKRVAKPKLPGINKEVPEISMPVMWYNTYARPGLNKGLLYEIIKQIRNNRKAMAQGHPFGQNMGQRKLIGGLATEYPIHPGAAKFYKENGWWNKNLTVGSQ